MKIVSARIYSLDIPFVETFSHTLSVRDSSSSIVVKLTAESGVSGFGEGVPRQYVTGESRDACAEYIASELFPRVAGVEFDGFEPGNALDEIDSVLRVTEGKDGVTWNASRCAIELAVVDCLFRYNASSVNRALTAMSSAVTYSAVIPTGSSQKIEELARRYGDAGFAYVKMKVSMPDDVRRVAAVRKIMGDRVSIRLDANAAFDSETAIQFLESVQPYDIECMEQPIPRGTPGELAALRARSPIRLMVDESLVTFRDAKELIEADAVDYLNLRISKCGGLCHTLAIAKLAQSANVGIQLGCHVGETAILSAAGRHLAAHLPDLRFVEGSYGKHLLTEDIAEEDIIFEPGGVAGLLAGNGLGITVREDIVRKYSRNVVEIS